MSPFAMCTRTAAKRIVQRCTFCRLASDVEKTMGAQQLERVRS